MRGRRKNRKFANKPSSEVEELGLEAKEPHSAEAIGVSNIGNYILVVTHSSQENVKRENEEDWKTVVFPQGCNSKKIGAFSWESATSARLLTTDFHDSHKRKCATIAYPELVATNSNSSISTTPEPITELCEVPVGRLKRAAACHTLETPSESNLLPNLICCKG